MGAPKDAGLEEALRKTAYEYLADQSRRSRDGCDLGSADEDGTAAHALVEVALKANPRALPILRACIEAKPALEIKFTHESVVAAYQHAAEGVAEAAAVLRAASAAAAAADATRAAAVEYAAETARQDPGSHAAKDAKKAASDATKDYNVAAAARIKARDDVKAANEFRTRAAEMYARHGLAPPLQQLLELEPEQEPEPQPQPPQRPGQQQQQQQQ